LLLAHLNNFNRRLGFPRGRHYLENFAMKFIVRIEHDCEVESPSNDDCSWTLHSFNRRHRSFTHPDELGISVDRDDDGTHGLVAEGELAKKLENGLAFWLSYFEHGQCMWFLKDGPVPGGVEFRWDGTRYAGLLVWDNPENEIGAKTREDRAKDAAGFLEDYTSWANGEGYYYVVETEDGEHIDSCGGFLGVHDYWLEQIAFNLVGQEFEVEGDGSQLAGRLRKVVAKLATAL
jgi:hypothetical protein